MELIRLTTDYELKPFDCGDADLNGFLLNDAKHYAEKNLAFTYLLLGEHGDIIAYYSLLNDKISKRDTTNATWRKLKKMFPHQKHFNSYPAIKIGRFAVSTTYKGQGLGSELMASIKMDVSESANYSAFRFLTVDAYLEAIPFYEKNDFKMLISDEENDHTRTMYFDMIRM
ncbi:GNAT family N-acetyltransferase [Phocaeicola sp.]|jgi:predicted GNAT family N-acyltransferase